MNRLLPRHTHETQIKASIHSIHNSFAFVKYKSSFGSKKYARFEPRPSGTADAKGVLPKKQQNPG